MASQKIYVASLYRFGYELTVAAKKKKDAVDALMMEYEKTFAAMNPGTDCRTEESDRPYDDGKTFYDSAMESIEISTMTLGVVEWR